MANQLFNPNHSQQLKNCKLEKYKIDNDLKILYKVITTYNDTQPKILKVLPLEALDDSAADIFFMLMKKKQCDNFGIYFENNYDIKKINNLLDNHELYFTAEQLLFFKQFFISIKNAIIALFDMHIKPIINNTVDGNPNNSNSVSKALQTKPRILN